jgi:hypothetical protein
MLFSSVIHATSLTFAVNFVVGGDAAGYYILIYIYIFSWANGAACGGNADRAVGVTVMSL